MSVLNPLVRTVLLVKILLVATSARVNLAIQTGTARRVSCLVKLRIIFGCHRWGSFLSLDHILKSAVKSGIFVISY